MANQILKPRSRKAPELDGKKAIQPQTGAGWGDAQFDHGCIGLAGVAEPKAGTEGAIWGTPYYVAPERLNNEPADFRSDIYNLGAMLFHASAVASFANETGPIENGQQLA